MAAWFDAMTDLKIARGESFDCDFHTIPFHGADALLEKHYVSKRSRRQKGILAFVAQDADSRVFCYANGELRKPDQNDEILQFVQFWKQRTGRLPAELVFDSKLTTYANLSQLNAMGIAFLLCADALKDVGRDAPPRPRSAASARNKRAPAGATGHREDPRGLRVHRQLSSSDLGRGRSATNQRLSAPTLIGRYAQRMIIENGIADSIDFFHMDALSSAVPMTVNCDLQLTVMASGLYRLLASKIAHGYERAKSRHLFRDFVDATALVHISADEISVRYQKRAHNPLLLAAGFDKTDAQIPWLGSRRLRLVFG
jgi:hypothetical protein